MEKLTEVSDIYLAAALHLLLNQEPTLKVVHRRTLFCFPSSEDLYKAMNSYNNGEVLNALEYSQTIKRFRAEMIMRRKIEANG